MIRAAVIALVAAMALSTTGCGGRSGETSTTSKRQLTDLQNIGQLQTAFKTGSGQPRLIMLVSPT